MPDEIEATVTFDDGGGCVSIVETDLKRKCPPVPFHVQTFLDVSVTVMAEYVSKRVSLGCGVSATIAIAPYYISSTSSEPALWIKTSGSGSPIFINRLHDGFPVIKFTGATNPCSQAVNLLRQVNGISISAPLTDSWSSIAAQVTASGMFSFCESVWEESLPNGWDLATLIFDYTLEGGGSLTVSSGYTVGEPCQATEINAVFALDYNSRFHGGFVKFFGDPVVELDSKYGSSILRIDGPNFSGAIPVPDGCSYYTPQPPFSFAHGAAPYAAMAKTNITILNRNPLVPDPSFSATLLAKEYDTIHPKGFTEAIGATPCSDCDASVSVTGLVFGETSVSTDDYGDLSIDISDCPSRYQSMSESFYSGTTTGTTTAKLWQTYPEGAVYNSKEISEATVFAGTYQPKWKLTVSQVSPPVTFRITVSGEQTATISGTATDLDVQAALENLPSLVSGDVSVSGGPFPATPIVVEFLNSHPVRDSFSFSATSATASSLEATHLMSHFKSEGPVNTNYPGNSSLMDYVATTAFKKDSSVSPAEYSFVESPISFSEQAETNLTGCTETYRNSPYENIVADVKDIQYESGAFQDVFWPEDSVGGATGIVETTGSQLPAAVIRAGLVVGCSINSGLTGGKDGLTYRAYPGIGLIGGKYLSASGETYFKVDFSRYHLVPGPGFSQIPVFSDPSNNHEFSTNTDMEDWGQGWAACTTTFTQPQVVSVMFPPGVTAELAWNYISNGCVNVSGPCDAIYEKFSQPLAPTTIGNLGGCVGDYLGDTAESGVLPGAFTSLEHFGYHIVGWSLSIDPCNGQVVCQLQYQIVYTARVPISVEITWDAYSRDTPSFPWILDTPHSYISQSYYEYGFVEPHLVTFSSNVYTDLSLRPNLDKTRIITLSLVSDVIDPSQVNSPCLLNDGTYVDGKAFFADWKHDGFGQMPSPSAWAVLATKAASPLSATIGTTTYGLDGNGNQGDASTALTKSVLTSNTSSIGTFSDPSSVTTLQVIDFSGSTVDVYMEPAAGAHDVVNCPSTLIYNLPSTFPDRWKGIHELVADTNEPDWIEELPVAPFVKAMLSPEDWTLTLFDEDCSSPVNNSIIPLDISTTVRKEPRRVVARYRLPCSQCRRFNCNKKNYLELVSCDRSIGKWPFYLKVYPK